MTVRWTCAVCYSVRLLSTSGVTIDVDELLIAGRTASTSATLVGRFESPSPAGAQLACNVNVVFLFVIETRFWRTTPDNGTVIWHGEEWSPSPPPSSLQNTPKSIIKDHVIWHMHLKQVVSETRKPSLEVAPTTSATFHPPVSVKFNRRPWPSTLTQTVSSWTRVPNI